MSVKCSCFAFLGGGSRDGGGSLEPSVFPSPQLTPQDGKAAHGPRHPAMNIPLRFCRDYISFAGRFFWMGFCSVVKFFLSLGSAWCLVVCP